jgi:DNA invertase Pin-like site-specific DNA recombinase
MMAKKQIRCAIYTRKSTEHGLELEFNSLQAQREACEAYVKSQAHEGWSCLPTKYDDAAYSGGNLERPALKQLLKDIDGGKVDVIVVYKIDRLTRSLADFAKLVEQFDAKSISFVAITQQFNTTTSMGRLTLNVLLSFAQFERELSSERVRDKVAASRRKGKWTGGTVPLGYDAVDKKLLINKTEADNVRTIFERYLELGTVLKLQGHLKARQIYSKVRQGKNGPTGGVPFTYGPLAHLLRNRIYVGEIGHQGKWFPGEHKPVVDRDLFERVQAALDAHTVDREVRSAKQQALLAGLLYDDRGNRMSPSFSTKNGVRYRFYVSSAILRGRKRDAGSIARAPATQLEALITNALKTGANGAASIPLHEMTRDAVSKITLSRNQITIQPKKGRAISLPWEHTLSRPHVEIDDRAASASAKPNEALLQGIARAHHWVGLLTKGAFTSIEALGKSEQLHPKVIRKTIALAYLSPAMTASILRGEVPPSTTLTSLIEGNGMHWDPPSRTQR